MVEATRTYFYTGHTGALYALAQGRNAHELLSGGSDRMIAAWQTGGDENGTLLAQLPAGVYSLCMIPGADTHHLLAGTAAGSIHFMVLNETGSSGAEEKILQVHDAQIFDLCYIPAHGLVCSTAADGQFAVTDMRTQQFRQIRKLTTAKARGIALHPQQQELAVACGDGMVYVLELPGFEIKKVIPAHQLSANTVRYHPGGKYLLSGGRDAHLNCWDCNADYALIKSIPAHNFAIYDIVFSPDEQFIATASRDKTVKIWDSHTVEFLLRISKEKHNGHNNSVNRLLWNTTALFSAGDDRVICGWKVMKF